MHLPLVVTAVLVLGVGASACGGSATHNRAKARASRAGATGPAPPAAAAADKRRYLAHFRNDCRSAGRVGKATGDVVGRLTAEIARGNLAAVAELNLFLQRLAAAYQAGLTSTRALGLPPGPDSHDGRAYLDDTQRMISAIQAMGAAVGRLDAKGLHAAAARLHAATAAARRAAKRYGFPTCGGTSATPPAPSVSVGAPV